MICVNYLLVSDLSVYDTSTLFIAENPGLISSLG